MCHRSWVAETVDEHSNERLEFLGDAVLGWVVADMAFRAHADQPEGRLTDIRKSVVNATALAEVAAAVDIGPALLLGRGEDAAGGREKPSILSDALEAVIGAVYLDGGAQAAVDLIDRLLGERVREATHARDHLDHKTLLQELLQRHRLPAATYAVTNEGPDHAKHFHARVLSGAEELAEGHGRSKKQAEQASARAAYALLLDRLEAGR